MLKAKYALIFFVVLFVILRVASLTILPIFSDESIFIYWAKLIAVSNRQWFISLVDGEPPLFIWSIVMFLKILPSSWYLIAGRLPSVIAGVGFLFGVFELSKALNLLQSQKIIFIAFCALSPFFFFFSGTASYDMLMACFFVWTMAYTFKTSESPTWKNAFMWAVFAALTALSKASGQIALFLPIIIFLFYISEWRTQRKHIIVSLAIFITISELLSHVLIFSHGYHTYVANSFTRYLVTSFGESWQHVLAMWIWIAQYLTYPLFCFFILGIAKTSVTSLRKSVFYMLTTVLPVGLIAIFVGSPFPRYILFTLPFFLLAASDAMIWIYTKSHVVGRILFVVGLVAPILFTGRLVLRPFSAPFPSVDALQYVTGDTSGYGLTQVYNYLNQQKKPFHIITLGGFSTYPYAFNLYYWGNPQITISPLWPVTASSFQYVRKVPNTFVVLKFNSYENHKNFLKELGLKKVFEAQKPGGMYPIVVGVPD